MRASLWSGHTGGERDDPFLPRTGSGRPDVRGRPNTRGEEEEEGEEDEEEEEEEEEEKGSR